MADRQGSGGALMWFDELLLAVFVAVFIRYAWLEWRR